MSLQPSATWQAMKLNLLQGRPSTWTVDCLHVARGPMIQIEDRRFLRLDIERSEHSQPIPLRGVHDPPSNVIFVKFCHVASQLAWKLFLSERDQPLFGWSRRVSRICH